MNETELLQGMETLKNQLTDACKTFFETSLKAVGLEKAWSMMCNAVAFNIVTIANNVDGKTVDEKQSFIDGLCEFAKTLLSEIEDYEKSKSDTDATKSNDTTLVTSV